jgi:hypothetical protein
LIASIQNSLDASGERVFLNLIDLAEAGWIRGAGVNSDVGHFLQIMVTVPRLIFPIAVIILAGCLASKPIAQESIPHGWQRIDAEGYFSFYLPPSMQLRSTERCVECAWGSTYADERICLYAAYTSWNEEYAEQYLTKQADYQKQITEIGGKKAKVQSWRNQDSPYGFAYTAEVRFYGGKGKLVARLSASCKAQSDVDTAKQIFRTANSFKT